MKTIILLAVATATLSAQAQTLRKSLEIPQPRASESDLRISKEMSKSFTTENGLRIRYIDKKEVDRALGKVKGKVTIEFGKENQVPVDKGSESMGGVVVGSGADGVAVTTNANTSDHVVVSPPLVRKMSINLVGGQQMFCVKHLLKNKDGSWKRFGTPSDARKCEVTGTPVQLTEAGTYLVESSGGGWGKMMVDLEEGENKIIPLRQIEVPATSYEKILFSLHRDFETSESLREQMAIEAYTSDFTYLSVCTASLKAYAHEITVKTCEFLKSVSNFAAFRQSEYLSLKENSASLIFRAPDQEDGYEYEGQIFGIYDIDPDAVTNPGRNPYHGDSKQGELMAGKTQSSYIFYVMPGVYSMKWWIEGFASKVTKGIYVP